VADQIWFMTRIREEEDYKQDVIFSSTLSFLAQVSNERSLPWRTVERRDEVATVRDSTETLVETA